MKATELNEQERRAAVEIGERLTEEEKTERRAVYEEQWEKILGLQRHLEVELGKFRSAEEEQKEMFKSLLELETQKRMLQVESIVEENKQNLEAHATFLQQKLENEVERKGTFQEYQAWHEASQQKMKELLMMQEQDLLEKIDLCADTMTRESHDRKSEDGHFHIGLNNLRDETDSLKNDLDDTVRRLWDAIETHTHDVRLDDINRVEDHSPTQMHLLHLRAPAVQQQMTPSPLMHSSPVVSGIGPLPQKMTQHTPSSSIVPLVPNAAASSVSVRPFAQQMSPPTYSSWVAPHSCLVKNVTANPLRNLTKGP